jgi:hypothetical protein
MVVTATGSVAGMLENAAASRSETEGGGSFTSAFRLPSSLGFDIAGTRDGRPVGDFIGNVLAERLRRHGHYV